VTGEFCSERRSPVATRKILVVDDDGHVCTVIAESLSRRRSDAVSVGGVAAARESLQTNALDAVVADMNMRNPEGDGSRAGFAVLKTIAGICPQALTLCPIAGFARGTHKMKPSAANVSW